MDAKVFVVAKIEGWRKGLAERAAKELGVSPAAVQVEVNRGAIEIRVDAEALEHRATCCHPKQIARAVELILQLVDNHWRFVPGAGAMSNRKTAHMRAIFIVENYGPAKIRKIVPDKQSPLRSELASIASSLSDIELREAYEKAMQKSQTPR
jgi:hypothetical protein